MDRLSDEYLVRTNESLYSVQSMTNIRIRLIFDSSNTLVNRLGPNACHYGDSAVVLPRLAHSRLPLFLDLRALLGFERRQSASCSVVVLFILWDFVHFSYCGILSCGILSYKWDFVLWDSVRMPSEPRTHDIIPFLKIPSRKTS